MNQSNDYYQILGLQPGASFRAVKEAYRALTKQWHPDLFTDPAQQREAEAKIKQLNLAYEQLKAQLLMPGAVPGAMPAAAEAIPAPRASVPRPNQRFDAAEYYRQGAELAQAGRHHEALEALSLAIKLRPDYAEAYRYRGFIRSVLGYEINAEADLLKAKSLLAHRPARPPAAPPRPQPAARTPTARPSHPAWSCITWPGYDNVGIALSDSRLISAGREGRLLFWNCPSSRPNPPQSYFARLQAPSPISAMALSQDGLLLAGGSPDGQVHLWHAGSRQLLRTLETGAQRVTGLALSADRQFLLAAPSDQLQLWQLKTGKFQVLEAGAALALAAQGMMFASSSERTVRLWQAGSGELLRTIGVGASGTALAFSPSGKYLAIGTATGEVNLWTLDGRRAQSLDGHWGSVQALAFAPQGGMLASGGEDGKIKIWNLATGQLRVMLTEHRGPVVGLAYSADALTLVSSSADHTIKLWAVR